MLMSYRPEINIKPWKSLFKDLEEGAKEKKWVDREPYAYWKGNPYVGSGRLDLLKCNVTHEKDWNARLYAQVKYYFGSPYFPQPLIINMGFNLL